MLIYDGANVREAAASPETRKEIMAEWVEALTGGPGIVAFRNAFADHAPIDASNAHYWAIIEEERKSKVGGGDHFAKPGANDRIWNALEKLCLRDPEVFAAYYGNAIVALISEAWLGPAYQVTSQLNVVNPGGAAQVAHRDYHMGFQAAREIERFPVHCHRLSPMLTLQGAVAHCDMPLETGPTLYLPFSQAYLPGYLAAGRDEFRAYFNAHHVQLPLSKGDAVFFNPALFHAAGTNRSKDVRRIANLLQVSSAYGRAMESVDRLKMSLALYPALRRALAGQGADARREADNAIAACAEGYSFPTNLDRDPPIGGMAPQSQQALMRQALAEDWTQEAFAKSGRRASGAQAHLTRRATIGERRLIGIAAPLLRGAAILLKRPVSPLPRGLSATFSQRSLSPMYARGDPLRALADRISPYRRRAHRVVQLALRQALRGQVSVAHRGHRPRAFDSKPPWRRSSTGSNGSASTGTARRSASSIALSTIAKSRNSCLRAAAPIAATPAPRSSRPCARQARLEGKPMRYDGRWRDRDPSEAPPGVAPVIRLRAVQEGATIIDDKVQGKVTFANKDLDDLVLLRSDGNPTYMLAVVVDDHDMGVTHVIRGDDHLTNAARQTQIYQALGWNAPVWAHIPLIHGPDGAKLSKRHGALGVDAYRAMGYLPAALRNYLARLGWSHGDKEFFTDDELVAAFDLGAIGRSASRFDFAKLENMNGHFMRATSDAELYDTLIAALPYLRAGPRSPPDSTSISAPSSRAAIPGLKERAKTLVELLDGAGYLFAARPLAMDEKAAEILANGGRTHLAALSPKLAAVSEWSGPALEAVVRGYAEAQGAKLGSIAQPLRAALTGRSTSPGIFDVLAVLGRKESLGRIEDQAEAAEV